MTTESFGGEDCAWVRGGDAGDDLVARYRGQENEEFMKALILRVWERLTPQTTMATGFVCRYWKVYDRINAAKDAWPSKRYFMPFSSARYSASLAFSTDIRCVFGSRP